MFAALLGAVRADIDRQIGWAKHEVKRQTRYTALIGILAGVAALATLGAIVVGLIALHSWLAMQIGPFVAHGVIGGGLLLLALVLFALAFTRRRPRLVARPPGSRAAGGSARDAATRQLRQRRADVETGDRHTA